MAQGARKKIDPRRRALLAKAHIAPKELGIPDEDVRGILRRNFKKESRADLTELELGYLVDYFVEHGWRPKGGNSKRETGNPGTQAEKLRERAIELAGEMENGEARLLGLVRKMCGVDRLEWARDASKLRRLLAVMERIKRV